MDQNKIKFLETRILKLLVWFRCIDDIFFICIHGEEKLKTFMEDFNLLVLTLSLRTSLIKKVYPF